MHCTHLDSNLSSSGPEPSPHWSTIDRLYWASLCGHLHSSASKWCHWWEPRWPPLSLSFSELSRWPPEPRSGCAIPWSRVHHGLRSSRGPMIHRPDPWFFLYKNNFEKSQKMPNCRKAPRILINLEAAPTFFKLNPKLYHNQFSI
jgi:hypothetical protein